MAHYKAKAADPGANRNLTGNLTGNLTSLDSHGTR
jgi:hypothetical protein